MTTYTTTKVKFEELSKKVNRIFKKLDKINGHYDFHTVREFVKLVPVYAVDEINKCQVKVDEMNVECVEYVLTFDPYVVGNYKLGAVLEAAENENLVYVCDTTINFADYRTKAIKCEHCGTNHKRTKGIVLVNNEDGTHKMVGSACVKDFIGYNVEQFAKYFKEIEQILLEDEEAKIYDNERHLYRAVIDVTEYLANCIKIIDKDGYNKELKYNAITAMTKNNIEEEYIEKANKVINFFKNEYTDDFDSFVNNTRIYLVGYQPVVNANGFVAYAYELYKKIQEKIAKQAELNAQKAISNFVGNIGEKVTVTGTVKIAGGYETDFGYVRIYKFTDKNGNTYVWKTSTYIYAEDNNGNQVTSEELKEITIAGTIKAHNEYNGEKQTVLTRCKVRGYVA